MISSRLHKVVRVRQLQERVARAAVLSRRQAAARAVRRRSSAVRLVDELAAETPSDAPALVAQRRRLDGGVRAVLAAGEDVGEARRAVDGSLDAWMTANRRLDGVQRLDERRAASEQVELDRRAYADVDDLTVSRWNRTREAPAARDVIDGGS